jgi:DNA-directed RNA polymerase specialized sigma24 family protein
VDIKQVALNSMIVANQSDPFADFVAANRRALRQVLVARFGVDVGSDATADAFAYAFEHWDYVAAMANPLGYLYRVGQTSARRHHRRQRPIHLPPVPEDHLPMVEPGLTKALTGLPPDQRTVVLLIHAFDWSYAQAAQTLDVSVGKVRNDLSRGMARLRSQLGGTEQ